MDAGGTLEPNQISPSLTDIFNPQTFHLFSTGAAELMRPHIVDCLNILSDVHMIRKAMNMLPSLFLTHPSTLFPDIVMFSFSGL